MQPQCFFFVAPDVVFALGAAEDPAVLGMGFQ